MNTKSLVIGWAVALAGACNAGPEPGDASHASSIPITNTAAQVENVHALPSIEDSPSALAVLAEGDRTPADRALDTGRQSADVLTYLGVTPGMRVAELGAGSGYFSELLARSTGPTGQVFSENPPSLLSRGDFAAAWSARLALPENANVVAVRRELGTPLPPTAHDLDLVYLGLFYRDLPSIGVDRDALATRVFAALRPEGRFVVIDRSPPERPGDMANTHALHTEESRNARLEIERAGFRFANEGRFLRASTVTSDWNHTPAARPTPLETQDRFFLTFIK